MGLCGQEKVLSVNFLRAGEVKQLMSAHVEAGVVSAKHWNHTNGAASGKRVGLQDSHGERQAKVSIGWKSANTWGDGSAGADAARGIGDAKLRLGYLDDSHRQAIEITMDGLPYRSYELILYFSSDVDGGHFLPARVNGKLYETSGEKSVYGEGPRWSEANVLRVKGLSGPLVVEVARRDATHQEKRGSVAALQVVEERKTHQKLASEVQATRPVLIGIGGVTLGLCGQ
ncbi:hypothetical protein [Rubritalea tangerina]|uniref:hypothetical protein n=1 Tax=Rubritalea tangerina TaxID=430798 RepID=UPI0036075917